MPGMGGMVIPVSDPMAVIVSVIFPVRFIEQVEMKSEEDEWVCPEFVRLEGNFALKEFTIIETFE
jgi:hypothetical protein